MLAVKYGVLEWSFLGLLALMTVLVGLFSVVVVVRVVEPRGLKALLLKLGGKNPPGYRR